jgi:DNA-binding transcriptional ArsR family regulator
MDVVSISGVAGLVGDPARARMLTALMDGRARTAKELAYGAGVTPQTTSSHLAKLVGAGLLVMERQSRHRYFRLASPSVGHVVEALMAVAPASARPRPARAETPLEAIRLARTCYDHLAGRLGVAMTDAMVTRRLLKPVARDFVLTPAGERFLRRFGVDPDASRQERRAFACQCLDWSERRAHLAGALGAAVARRFLALHWVKRVAEERRLVLTEVGRRALRTWFGVRWSVAAMSRRRMRWSG